MRLWVETKSYKRKFLLPLTTSYGPWRWRRGIIIKVRDSAGATGYGEVCPLPWFGTETLEMAENFWQSRIGWVESEEYLDIPDSLPATQFATETGLFNLKQKRLGTTIAPITLSQEDLCGLLPAGNEALTIATTKLELGYQTLKWKIGVFPIDQELAWLEALVSQLEEKSRIRLDANGGLTPQEAELWLKACDSINLALGCAQRATDPNPETSPSVQREAVPIEFLEQPLSPDQFEAMLGLGKTFQTPIALDESITGLAQFAQNKLCNWPGMVVIKPAVTGSPLLLKQLLNHWGERVIFSSAFETNVGRQAALQLALHYYCRAFSHEKFPALGFDTLGYFADTWDQLDPEQLWEQI
jgi:O-succinylbenzoate synthase